MKTQLLQTIKAAMIAGGVGIITLGSVSSYAAVSLDGINFSGLPGLNDPGSPAFGQSVMVKFKYGKTGSDLFASYHNGEHISSLTSGNSLWNISNTTYDLAANFNSSGNFTGGTVAISGRISGLGINTTQTLMTANLTSFGKNSSGSFYGFNTANIVCNSAVSAAVDCTKNESVYFGLDNAQSSMFKSWSTKGIALTTIPVPAAVWLFGSGLVGLVGCARRGKKTTS